MGDACYSSGLSVVSSGTLDARITEVGAATVGLLFQLHHLFVGHHTQFVLGTSWKPTADNVLEFGILTFVRIELQAVAGQLEHLNLGGVLAQPRVNWLAVMQLQLVQDQEYLAIGFRDQGLGELDQTFVVERAIDDHPTGFALVGHCGEHRQLLASTANVPDNGCLSARSKAPTSSRICRY